MAQIGCALCGWEEVEEAADLAPGLFDGAHVGLSEEGFQLGEDHFDGVEVGRSWPGARYHGACATSSPVVPSPHPRFGSVS